MADKAIQALCERQLALKKALYDSWKASWQDCSKERNEDQALVRWLHGLWCKYKCTGYKDSCTPSESNKPINYDGYDYYPAPIISLSPISVEVPSTGPPDIGDVTLDPVPYTPSVAFVSDLGDVPPEMRFQEPISEPVSDLWLRDCGCSERTLAAKKWGQKKSTSKPKTKDPKPAPRAVGPSWLPYTQADYDGDATFRTCAKNALYYDEWSVKYKDSYDACVVNHKAITTAIPDWLTKMKDCGIDLTDKKNATNKPGDL